MKSQFSDVDISILKQRAYNLRWAALPADIIPLTAADPDYRSPEAVADALTKYVQDRYWSYGPAEGLPQFRESLANFYANNRNLIADPNQIIATDSAAYGIYMTCKAFLRKGDEAIIFDPVDFLFQYSVNEVGGKAIRYSIPAGSDDITFAGLEDLITDKTRLICLCNPLNPTGKVFTPAELTILGNIACKYDLIILSDEIWSDIIFTPFKFTSIAAISEAIRARTVIVTGFSKSYGLAGLRVGAVTSFDPDVYSRLIQASLHNSTVHGANTAGQIAAATAMDHCADWLKKSIEHLQNMRDLCVHELNSIPGVTCIAPEGCYVAFANIKGTGLSSTEVADVIRTKGKVAVVPGREEWFGPAAEGYIRLSFATSEEILTEAMSRIKKTMCTI